MKKRFALFIALISLFFMVPHTYAADFTLWIDGANPELYEDHPYIKQGRVMVPLRLISENFGYDISWNNAKRSVTMVPANDRLKNKAALHLRIGENTIFANDQAVATTDVPAEIKNNYTFVPLRAIAELFGYPVRWNEAERAAIVGSDEPIPYVNRFSVKDMTLSVDNERKGTIRAFAEGGQLYVQAKPFAKAMAMNYNQVGMTFSDDPMDLTIRMTDKDEFSITFDDRYTTSSDGLNFGRYDMNNYKILGRTAYIPLGRLANAKHMNLQVRGNHIILTTDPTPTEYPITIMEYKDESYATRFTPSRSNMVIYWNGQHYVLKHRSGEMTHFGQYMDYIFSEEGNAQLEESPDAVKHQLSFGGNNHFYLQRQAGMVIGGISD